MIWTVEKKQNIWRGHLGFWECAMLTFVNEIKIIVSCNLTPLDTLWNHIVCTQWGTFISQIMLIEMLEVALGSKDYKPLSFFRYAKYHSTSWPEWWNYFFNLFMAELRFSLECSLLCVWLFDPREERYVVHKRWSFNNHAARITKAF